jgi:hypothetical protein
MSKDYKLKYGLQHACETYIIAVINSNSHTKPFTRHCWRQQMSEALDSNACDLFRLSDGLRFVFCK